MSNERLTPAEMAYTQFQDKQHSLILTIPPESKHTKTPYGEQVISWERRKDNYKVSLEKAGENSRNFTINHSFTRGTVISYTDTNVTWSGKWNWRLVAGHVGMQYAVTTKTGDGSLADGTSMDPVLAAKLCSAMDAARVAIEGVIDGAVKVMPAARRRERAKSTPIIALSTPAVEESVAASTPEESHEPVATPGSFTVITQEEFDAMPSTAHVRRRKQTSPAARVVARALTPDTSQHLVSRDMPLPSLPPVAIPAEVVSPQVRKREVVTPAVAVVVVEPLRPEIIIGSERLSREEGFRFLNVLHSAIGAISHHDEEFRVLAGIFPHFNQYHGRAKDVQLALTALRQHFSTYPKPEKREIVSVKEGLVRASFVIARIHDALSDTGTFWKLFFGDEVFDTINPLHKSLTLVQDLLTRWN